MIVTRARRTLAAVVGAATLAVSGAATAGALTPELTGGVVASDPQMSLADSSYGKTVNTSWKFTNTSNHTVRSLGVAYLRGSMDFVKDSEGEPMRVNCLDGAFPLAPKASVTCMLWRIVTPEEKKAGRTTPVAVDFRPGYGPGWPDIEYYRMQAPLGESVDLLTGRTIEPEPAPAAPATGSLGSLEGVTGGAGSTELQSTLPALLGSTGR